MTVVIPEPVSVAIFEHGFYEERLTRMLLGVIGPGATFFDVGAHFGYYSLLASWIVGDEGRVVAFEPTPSSQKILGDNLGQLENAKVEPLAVWSGTGVREFRDFGVQYSAFNSFFDPRLEKGSSPSSHLLSVETTSIDAYVERTGTSPDVVKVDAESSEVEIVNGMAETLSARRPIIAVEIGDAGVANAPTTSDILVAMSKFSYVPSIYERGRLGTVERDQVEGFQNILFIPEERAGRQGS